MLRTSTFLAIALSATAICSATVPAAAFPLKLPSTAPVLTKPQESQVVSHIPTKVVDAPQTIPAAPGMSSVNKKVMIPAPGISSVGKALDNCTTNPKLCQTSVTPPWPPKPWPPIPHCEAMSGEALQRCLRGLPNPGPDPDNDKDEHHHPVVIFVPQASVQVPVAVPAAVPYSAPVRVATGSGSTSTATAQPQPVVTPACVTAADIPALGAAIDQLLPTAQLSAADMSKITELRQLIQLLATDGKVAAARDVEEDAMNRLGYQKVWLRCGLGTFEWEKQAATTQANQAK
ncbi:hypothetical protein L6654_06000 [Bradyrhizobium sp. WYCCWR 13023]|uniref:Secreted protein n=1 Tax=Bradyrhizobium zhengyangense TaxID=2911009 RepID=A0A9X1UF76_9BRAD|nr:MULTISPECIES: hypothetical protein [Bradyrhizobium]MCG2626177.1 hypothetical protein [Bradyrhizobium zhengyangense]